jgi:hypothetical protein
LVAAFLLGVVHAASAHAQEWNFLDGPAYPGRMSAYDWARQRLVVLGSDGATWEITGNELLSRQVLGASPPARTRAAMVYDFANDRTVLFGGMDASRAMLNDTWFWNGMEWSADDSPIRPPARSDAAITYDLLRGRIILFGGQQRGVGLLQDTWEHDGSRWIPMQTATTPGPNAPVMTYDIVRGVAVMITHAGILGSPVSTWEWDGNDWTLRATSGPTSSSNDSMAYDFTRRRAVLIGGVGNEQSVWEWDGGSWQQRLVPAAPSRLDPAVHYNPASGEVEVFGGIDFRMSSTSVMQGGSRSDTHSWDGTTWRRRHGDLRPAGRQGHVLSADPLGRVLLFGGLRPQPSTSDTWTWDGNRWTEHMPTTSPRPLVDAGAVLDAARSETLLFGGNSSGTLSAELWAWNGNTWSLRDAGTGPVGRFEPALAFDVGRLVTVLFGGFARQGTAMQPLGDTWEWDGSAWLRRTPSTSPSPRAGAAIAYDPLRQRTVLFGGRSGFTASHQLDDTWEWDGLAWQRMTPTVSPTALLSPSLHFDPSTNRMLLIGTMVSTTPFETQVWHYSGGTWSQLHSSRNEQVGGQTSLEPTRGRIVSLKFHSLAEWTSSLGSLARTGPGCGAEVPRLATRTRPRLGAASFGLETAALPLQPAVFVLAFAPGAVPIGNGCTLHLGGALIPVATSVDAFGIATLRLPLADSQRLRGASLHAQALILYPFEPLGMRVSDAIRWTVGD